MTNNFFKKAKPIWAKGREREMNLTCLFLSELKKGEYKLKITCRNFYRAMLNNKLLGYGPARGAHGYARVDEYAIKSQKDGYKLIIEAVGYNCKSFYSLDEPAFLQAEITDMDGNIISATGESGFKVGIFKERVQKVSRFSYQRAFSESYNFIRLVEDCLNNFEECEFAVVNGAKLLPRGVSYPIYDMANAKLCETGVFNHTGKGDKYRDRYMSNTTFGAYTIEELTTFPSDDIYDLEYALNDIGDSVKVGQYAVYSFKTSETGFISIDADILEKATILILFDEVDFREEKLKDQPMNICFYRNTTYNIVEYRVEKGILHHTTFEPYTAKYLKVVVLEGDVKINQIGIVRYENPDCDNFDLSTFNGKQREIVEAAIRTFKHNAVDVLTDCPSRERAGWMCDSWFSAQSEKLFTGDNKVERNLLENIALADKIENIPDAMIPMCYPADFEEYNFYIPNWAMWWVVELEDNFARTGDSYLSKISREKVYRLLDFFKKYENEDGLLENLESWVFVEWSKCNDPDYISGVNYPSNMMYASALASAGRLYNDDILIEKSKKIKQIIAYKSFNGKFFEDNAIRGEDSKLHATGHTTETCQYYAFFCGIASTKSHNELWNTLIRHFGPNRDDKATYPDVYRSNAFIGNYLRLIVLYNNGLYDEVLAESIDYFAKMADTTGTLWENDSIYGSLDHAFASYIAVLISKILK